MEKKKDKNPVLLKPFEIGNFLTNNNTGWQNLQLPVHHIFHINKIEDFRPFLKYPIAPHRKTQFDFIFVTKGSVFRKKVFESYQIEPNTFFFLPAHQILADEFMSEDVEGFICHFDEKIFNLKTFQSDILNQFDFFNATGNPIVHIPEEEKSFILSLLEKLSLEYPRIQNNDFRLVSSYLLTLFFELSQYSKPIEFHKRNAASQITQHYKNALAQYIYQINKVADYAEKLSVSPDHLNKCVKATTGKSAHDLLAEVLLLEAKVLLKSEMQISEIALKLGQRNPSDFARFFKSKTGISPKYYQQFSEFV